MLNKSHMVMFYGLKARIEWYLVIFPNCAYNTPPTPTPYSNSICPPVSLTQTVGGLAARASKGLLFV